MALSASSPLSSSDPVLPPTQGLIFDHSHWGRLLICGEGGLEYLNNQSTNDLRGLGLGQGCETVFVTPTAQILDLTTVLHMEAGLWLITSPTRRHPLRETLMRTLMFVRGAKLEDRTEETVLWRLVGAGALSALEQLGVQVPTDLPPCHLWQGDLRGLPVTLIGGTGLGLPGVTLMADRDHAQALREIWGETDLVWGDGATWERLCLEQGRPEADWELTDSYNPLEAGLWSAISLSKGCYIGQEVLAKQVTYGRIRQTLWGVRLSGPVEPGTEVQIEGSKAGILTRSGRTEQGYRGLAYMRSKVSPQSGQVVQIGEATGELVQPPYLSYPEQK